MVTGKTLGLLQFQLRWAERERGEEKREGEGEGGGEGERERRKEGEEGSDQQVCDRRTSDETETEGEQVMETPDLSG